MEKKDQYTHLILKHLAGETQPAEDQTLGDWRTAHPDHQRWFEEVRDTWQAPPGDPQKARRAYQRLARRLGLPKVVASTPPQRKARWVRLHPTVRHVAAASVVLLIIAAFVYYFISPPTATHYQTGYGETATVELPDGSIVTLNANSSLSYQVSDKREAWLEGEAFFHVKKVLHPQTPQRFVVHTPQLDVEVLGTQFNVNDRRGKTTVVLNSGRVKLGLRVRQEDTLVMKPGELVEVSKEHPQFIKRAVDPQHASAWTTQRLIMDNTPLSEIALTIADYYGLTMRFEEPALANETLSGSIPMHQVEIFLQVLAASADVQLRKEGATLVVTEKGVP